MAKIIALFPGQGAQSVGMGKELYDNFPAVRQIYECAGDIFGIDVANLSFNGPEDVLKRDAQPAIFTLSAAAYVAARETMGEPDGVAGHSLGEYAALWCAGAYSLEDGMRILKARTAAMTQAAAATPGAMVAVMGKDPQLIADCCEKAPGKVWPVNFNLPTQTVIAGETAAVDAVIQLLDGAKTVRLEVEGAFHTPLMESAAEELYKAAAACDFSPCKIPFYSNLAGGRLDIEQYPEYFVKHMLSPVKFVQQVAAMAADGYDTCVEFGAKRVLSLAKKNNKSFATYHVEDLSTLKKTAEALGNA